MSLRMVSFMLASGQTAEILPSLRTAGRVPVPALSEALLRRELELMSARNCGAEINTEGRTSRIRRVLVLSVLHVCQVPREVSLTWTSMTTLVSVSARLQLS